MGGDDGVDRVEDGAMDGILRKKNFNIELSCVLEFFK